MKRKGQVTIFIIIAVVIIAFAGVFFAFKDNFSFDSSNPEIAPISNFVQECVYNTGFNGLYFLASSSGYFDIPENSDETGVAYYLIENKKYIPSKEIISKELDKYLEITLPTCVGNFSEFSEFNITKEEIISSSEIRDNEIILNVNYPLTIKKDNSYYRLSKFNNVKINLRYGQIYSIANEIVDSVDGQNLCTSCLAEISEEYNVKIDIRTTESEVLFYISDKSTFGFEPYFKFIFAVKNE